MKAQRLDHVHIKTSEFRKTADALQDITGHDFLLDGMEFPDMGMEVCYDPFPYSIEVMGITDANQDLAKLYEAWPDGIFCLTFKVPDYEEALTEMESKGYKQIQRYDTPGYTKEGLFDTLKALPFYIELIESPDDIANFDPTTEG